VHAHNPQAPMSDLIELRDVLMMLQGPRAKAGHDSAAIYASIMSARASSLPGGSNLQSGSIMRVKSIPKQRPLPVILDGSIVPTQSGLSSHHTAATDSGTLPLPNFLARLTDASYSNGSGAGWQHYRSSARQVSELQLALISSSACTSSECSGKAAHDPEVQQSLMEMVMGRRPLGAQVGGGD